jgi:hypothetical protein
MSIETNRPMAIAIFCTTLELGKEPFTKQSYWGAYQDLLLASRTVVSKLFCNGQRCLFRKRSI